MKKRKRDLKFTEVEFDTAAEAHAFTRGLRWDTRDLMDVCHYEGEWLPAKNGKYIVLFSEEVFV